VARRGRKVADKDRSSVNDGTFWIIKNVVTVEEGDDSHKVISGIGVRARRLCDAASALRNGVCGRQATAQQQQRDVGSRNLKVQWHGLTGKRNDKRRSESKCRGKIASAHVPGCGKIV
jgi:hypothetical protein